MKALEVLKTLWGNERTRAIVVLLLYIVFFTFVLLLINQPKKTIYRTKFDYLLEYKSSNEKYTVSRLRDLLLASELESTNYVEKSDTYIVDTDKYNAIMDETFEGTVRIKVYKDNSKVVIYVDSEIAIDLRR